MKLIVLIFNFTSEPQYVPKEPHVARKLPLEEPLMVLPSQKFADPSSR